MFCCRPRIMGHPRTSGCWWTSRTWRSSLVRSWTGMCGATEQSKTLSIRDLSSGRSGDTCFSLPECLQIYKHLPYVTVHHWISYSLDDQAGNASATPIHLACIRQKVEGTRNLGHFYTDVIAFWRHLYRKKFSRSCENVVHFLLCPGISWQWGRCEVYPVLPGH